MTELHQNLGNLMERAMVATFDVKDTSTSMCPSQTRALRLAIVTEDQTFHVRSERL